VSVVVTLLVGDCRVALKQAVTDYLEQEGITVVFDTTRDPRYGNLDGFFDDAPGVERPTINAVIKEQREAVFVKPHLTYSTHPAVSRQRGKRRRL